MLTCRISPGAIAVFTVRAGGVSRPPYAGLNLALHVGDDPVAVAENRRRLATALGVRPVWMSQVHGATVLDLDGPADEVGECDAVVVGPAFPDRAPAVLVADCAPVLLSDERGHHRAAVHVGRAGLLAEVLPRTLARLRALTDSPLRAVVGPHICGRCYEVGPALAAAAELWGARSTTANGTPGIDLLAGITAQLGDIPLAVTGGCTAEDTRLWSHRRDGVAGRTAGITVCDTPGAMRRAADLLR